MKRIFLFVVFFMVSYSTNGSILPYVYDEGQPIQGPYYDDSNTWQENQDDSSVPEDLEETDDLIDNNYPFPTADQLRNTRQKNCKWTGCHRLPITTKMSCPSGTFLESYKMCGARGSGTIDIQCCP